MRLNNINYYHKVNDNREKIFSKKKKYLLFRKNIFFKMLTQNANKRDEIKTPAKMHKSKIIRNAIAAALISSS